MSLILIIPDELVADLKVELPLVADLEEPGPLRDLATLIDNADHVPDGDDAAVSATVAATAEPATHLVATPSPRGFMQYPPVRCTYLSDVTVSESSAASEPHVWLTVSELDDLNNRDPDGPRHDANAHLTFEQAEQIRDQLTSVMFNHYQNPR